MGGNGASDGCFSWNDDTAPTTTESVSCHRGCTVASARATLPSSNKPMFPSDFAQLGHLAGMVANLKKAEQEEKEVEVEAEEGLSREDAASAGCLSAASKQQLLNIIQKNKGHGKDWFQYSELVAKLERGDCNKSPQQQQEEPEEECHCLELLQFIFPSMSTGEAEKLLQAAVISKQYGEFGCSACFPMPVQILPEMTLSQVHATLARVANRSETGGGGLRFASIQQQASSCFGVASTTMLTKQTEQKCALYLVPVWDWSVRPPQAAEFWNAAYTVARDNDGDDWIAPHMSVHSRARSLPALATKFQKMLSEITAKDWQSVLEVLHDPSCWTFEEDRACAANRNSNSKTENSKNSNVDEDVSEPSHDGGGATVSDSFVLHKASVMLPKQFREWLFQNQDADVLRPRKQDVRLQEQEKPTDAEDAALRVGRQQHQQKWKDKDMEMTRVPVEAPFHVSTYGFRASRGAKFDRDKAGNQQGASNNSGSVNSNTNCKKRRCLVHTLSSSSTASTSSLCSSTEDSTPSPQDLLAKSALLKKTLSIASTSTSASTATTSASPTMMSATLSCGSGSSSLVAAAAVADSNSDKQNNSIEVPAEQALRSDLASADWMWVLGVPGRTAGAPLVPSVFAAARLQSLAPRQSDTRV
mmetsp:Transcript_44645/g.105896  ORF Transcript_44645/g.105896 Transcript_44645/m.105896 type:complete len:644 (+) Transcript_44645:61-1992(+)